VSSATPRLRLTLQPNTTSTKGIDKNPTVAIVTARRPENPPANAAMRYMAHAAATVDNGMRIVRPRRRSQLQVPWTNNEDKIAVTNGKGYPTYGAQGVRE
jgi:hypothetical protein